ncbi:hypothetical protein C8Q78DRAFT_1075187 [Trametes maxima]|nr:hypothetical protein C8Q78DRAFT_1075187 [Trametes maxima]
MDALRPPPAPSDIQTPAGIMTDWGLVVWSRVEVDYVSGREMLKRASPVLDAFTSYVLEHPQIDRKLLPLLEEMQGVLDLLQRAHDLRVDPDLSARKTRCTEMASPVANDIKECLAWCKEYVEASRVRKVFFRSIWGRFFAAAFTRFLMRKAELLEVLDQISPQTVETTDSGHEGTAPARTESLREDMDSRVDQFAASFEYHLSPEEQNIVDVITSAGGERAVLQDHDSLLGLVSPIDTLTFNVGLSVYIDFERHVDVLQMTQMAHWDVHVCESVSKVWRLFRPIASPDVLSAVGDAVEAAAQMIPELLKILDVVAEVHPFTKLVVSAFNVAYKMYKTQKENDKRITVLHVEMSYMMDELRVLDDVQTEGMDSHIENRLQQLCRDTERDIMSCSHACEKYAQKARKRTFWFSSDWEEKFTGYVEIFRGRKEDFHRATTTLIKVGVDNIKADLKAGVDEIKEELKASVEIIKANLSQATRMDDVLLYLQSLPSTQTPLTAPQQEQSDSSAGAVDQGDSDSDHHGAQSEGVQDLQVLETEFRRQQQAWMEDSLDARLKAACTAAKIWRQQHGLIYYHVVGNPMRTTTVLADEDFRGLWEQMHWGRSKPAIHFARAVKEYFREKALRREISSEDDWAVGWLDNAPAQSIAEAVDEDSSGLVSLEEVNRLSQNKPASWSLIQWLAFKALAWQSIAEESIGIIDALLDKMFALRGDFEDSPETLIGIDLYLHAVWSRIFLLVRSFDPRTVPDLARLPEERRRRVAGEFQLLRDKLTVVRFHLPSVDAVNDVLGTERIETRVLPFIAVLLERHYAIMQLATTVALDPKELGVAAKSILYVLDVLETRHESLTSEHTTCDIIAAGRVLKRVHISALFKHADEDVAKRIGQYACCLFNYLHNPSAAWSRQAFHKIAVITSKELKVEPISAHPEDLLLYAYGTLAEGRTTGKARYPTVHLGVKCDNCSRDIVGARTVCMECGTDVTKTVNFCSVPRCRNAEVSVNTRPDLAAPHLSSHAVFRFEPQLHLSDFGRVDHQARKALEAAKKALRAGNEPPCCHCGRPVQPPCWACITCPDVFLCEECELRRTNEHSATHGLVRCQDERAAAERRTKAMENNILAMDGKMATIERRMFAMEEGLRVIDRRMEHMTGLLEKVAAMRSSKK